jgi:hypothetical protein
VLDSEKRYQVQVIHYTGVQWRGVGTFTDIDSARRYAMSYAYGDAKSVRIWESPGNGRYTWILDNGRWVKNH